ncbi:MAG TPA: oligopeptide/dipeptide ABC transporter ATP-binding protein [Gammaproteobacteria bacterium]|nr:oligopeptide/dipeptide ABC transporter ATP-binding protein [Gammaproteobacteria bacterium]
MTGIVLSAQAVERRFGGGRTLLGRRKPEVHAVQSLDLDVQNGETLGVVGESGCGKSTLARMLVGLDRPTSGSIRMHGDDLVRMAETDPRALARTIQYVFQDPASSLNPRKTIRDILSAPMIHLLRQVPSSRKHRLEKLLDAVNLPAEVLSRYPHEFSGGQAQRIVIARALAAEPRIIILDEPVSALDVSIQAQVLNLLSDLKDRFGLTYIFISHDLAVVESISDRVAVMYFGRIVELGNAATLFRAPRHPYTRLLLDSAPVPGKRKIKSEMDTAEVPDPLHPPPGCAFAPRCPRAEDFCRRQRPLLEPRNGAAQAAACHFPLPVDE